MTTTMAEPVDRFDLAAAPMRIGKVRLKVRDLSLVSQFYRDVLGLVPHDTDAGHAVLGTESVPLLELLGDPGLAANDPRSAGLFHTAFLLPGRADLARWLGFATEKQVALQGASDHIVSEAIYLADPEGNGIEIYADRPPARWRDSSGKIHMTTEPLDAQDLLGTARGTAWTGFPDGGSIGHVHLQVGDTGEAERFYRDVLGFELTSRYPGASFFGSGGYHHQLAGNVWNSRGAGRRSDGMAGLESVELVARDAATRAAIEAQAREAGIAMAGEGGATLLRDPWNIIIRLAP